KDWTAASAEELLADFGHDNTTVRMIAANEAATRASFKPASDQLLSDPAKVSTAVGLYAMVQERTGEMETKNYDVAIDFAKKNPDKVPTDSLTGMTVKALISRKEWGEAERGYALDCFKSFDSIRIKRAVIDGMTAHPHESFVEPLLEFAKSIPTNDTHTT